MMVGWKVSLVGHDVRTWVCNTVIVLWAVLWVLVLLRVTMPRVLTWMLVLCDMRAIVAHLSQRAWVTNVLAVVLRGAMRNRVGWFLVVLVLAEVRSAWPRVNVRPASRPRPRY